MTNATTLMSTWGDDGLFVMYEGTVRQEFAGRPVRGLTRDAHGGALAIVDGRVLYRGTPGGKWHPILTSSMDLACCIRVGDVIYAGTEDAQVLRIDSRGGCESLAGFETVPGRDKWYAGRALINGQLIGPPLGVRSMAATCDGRTLLVNVHVGGIPRSIDGGETWQPTIDIDVDVHDVCAHPTRPDWVIAAGAAGLCVSRDGGSTWTVEQAGLHASYCSAVAFAGDDILVAASTGHFTEQGAIYRRPMNESCALQRVECTPGWLAGICDTDCIDVRDSHVALADRAGNVYLSDDLGRTWSCHATAHPSPSALAII
jgi:photosystem II stability/assembly factor-like uncharacterized protein